MTRPIAFCVCMFCCLASAAEDPLPIMDCLLTPYVTVELGSSVVGVLESVPVRRGDRVRKGQVLATLEAGEVRASVALAEARAEFRNRRMERNEQLYQDELISIHDKDEMATEAMLSELELKVVRERLAVHTIVSPINGVVVDLVAAPGEYVQELPLMTLAQVDPITVEVVVPSKFFGRISNGSSAIVRPELGDELVAEVDVVDAVIDAASSTFGVALTVPNPDLKIAAGQTCSVSFAVSDEP